MVRTMESTEKSRREFLTGLGAVSLAGMSGVLSSCATDFGNIGLGPGLMPTLLIRPDAMMRKFSPHFPVNRDYQGLVNMQFADPVFSMVPQQEKVRVGLTTLGNLGGLLSGAGRGANRQLGGRCQLACGLRYDAETRQIFLKDAVLENFSLAGVPSQWTQGLQGVANTLGQNFLEKIPVYKVGTGNGMGFMKNMRVTEQGIKLSFGL